MTNEPGIGRKLLERLSILFFLPPLTLWITLKAILTKIFIVGKGNNVYQQSQDFDIICISHVSWDCIWQRNQHTMTQLSKRHKVIYCVPEMAHMICKYPARRKPSSPMVIGNLIYCKVIRLAGESRSAFIYNFNRFITEMELKRIAKKFGLKRPVLWFYFPFQENIVGNMGELLTIYDIQDNYTAFHWAPRKIAEMESQLIRNADVVFTGTHALLEKNKSNHKNITFFPCGVEFDHFSKTDLDKQPDDIKNLKNPILGYFGLIDIRIDPELLKFMAEKHPDWNIFMIGPIDHSLFKKPDMPNLHFVGQKDYKLLPYYLQRFDVCLMPFAINDLTSKINPTKTLEYFASGKPVVSTAIPDMIKYYSDVIGIANGKEEFVSLCEEAIAKSKRFDIVKGIALSKSKSWESIVGGMEDIIRDALKQKKS